MFLATFEVLYLEASRRTWAKSAPPYLPAKRVRRPGDAWPWPASHSGGIRSPPSVHRMVVTGTTRTDSATTQACQQRRPRIPTEEIPQLRAQTIETSASRYQRPADAMSWRSPAGIRSAASSARSWPSSPFSPLESRLPTIVPRSTTTGMMPRRPTRARFAVANRRAVGVSARRSCRAPVARPSGRSPPVLGCIARDDAFGLRCGTGSECLPPRRHVACDTRRVKGRYP